MVTFNNIISDVRSFNRFYTDILGLLDQHILDSGYSLTEARVLFEINKIQCCTASMLVKQLGIDRSYMSRIILKFQKNELISKTTSESDSRIKYIRLTDKGLRIFNHLNERSNCQIEDLLKPLGDKACNQIRDAMFIIRKNLTNDTNKFVLRPFTKKDIDYVRELHKNLYRIERKLSSNIFDKYIDKSIAAFVDEYNMKKDCMFMLEYYGKLAGSIAIKHIDNNTAQLRFFLIEPEARGKGAGRKMIDTIMNFCREKGYQHIFLWTISNQKVARHLYNSYGFQITYTQENHDWGTDVIEERWDLYI